MHSGEPIFHRDIRWPNIVQSYDNTAQWILIDWDDAATPPTRPAFHLDSATHAPEVFKADHGEEVDIWGIGKLILGAKTDIPDPLKQIGEWMSKPLPRPTALEALKKMKEYVSNF